MSSIPEEVYLEILVRVPVETTYICKCVCKSWLSLISNPNFVKMHLTQTTQKNHYRLMLRNYWRNSYLLHSISYDSLSSLLESSKAKNIAYYPVAMDYPFKSQDFGIELGGSINGLVCLWCNEDDREFLCLWNPATTEYKEIPKSPNDLSNDNTDLYALGYDYVTDDYKLIKSVFFEDKEENSPVDVYSLATNSWRSIQSIPYRFPFPREPGVLVNRALHWLGVKSAKDSSKTIVSLDVSEESFREVELPRVCLENKQDFRSVGVFEGCLCVVAFNELKSHFDVWVMQDYGVRESWTVHFSVIQNLVKNDKFMRLMWSFKNGEVLLRNFGDLLLYDPKHGKTRKLRKLTLLNEVENYVESLVPLNSGTYVGERKIEVSLEVRGRGLVMADMSLQLLGNHKQ